MSKIILLRHGQSQWNLENRFTGWTDVELSDKGREEAAAAGQAMKRAGLRPGVCFTSYLRRAIHTGQIALAEMGLDWIPMVKDWHLNERHYGALQGLNKAETAQEYGEEQVKIWRRSYDVRPPQLKDEDPRFPGHDAKYDLLSLAELPHGESLEDTIGRVRACWEELIVPAAHRHDVVLIAAHGNSLRALAMLMLHLTPEQIVSVEIPTGKPWVFDVDERMNVLSERHI
ncbi:MAG: 2,3-diphosphoglycerate-dependent phosphoglycerate mutase [Bacteroidales bacterium]|nr:2,3-diphosphoglycerate-dependent phosphoglycerate mutase [Bacteroidales bacterium]